MLNGHETEEAMMGGGSGGGKGAGNVLIIIIHHNDNNIIYINNEYGVRVYIHAYIIIIIQSGNSFGYIL